MLRENIPMTRNQASEPPLFFYCFPAKDPYYASVIGRSVSYGLKHSPKSRHLIYPIYGIAHYSSLRSKKRIPRWIKYIEFQLNSIKRQYLQQKACKVSLEKVIGKREAKNVEYIPFMRYLTSLVFYLIKNQISPLLKIHLFKDNQDFVNHFRLTNIPAGGLIVDTYIRYKGEAAVNSNHWFFKDIILRAFAIERALIPYFKRSKQVFYFGSYSTYIDHGISLRLACKNPNNIAITFGYIPKTYIIHNNLQQNILPSHAGYHHHYSRVKAEKLDIKIISAAEKSLKYRLEAKYDNSMSYMEIPQTKPDNKDFNLKSEGKNDLILMLHDFFDSPHIYQWILFPDFWSWAYETISFCAENNINLYVKPHPNQLPENNTVLSGLKAKFEEVDCIKWISKNIKNIDLFRLNPSAIISAYGSVAAEAAYLEIPVLMVGDHPGINFSIAQVVKSKEDYFSFLSQPSDIPKGSKTDAVLFTALHHKNSFDVNNQSLMQSLKTTLRGIDADPQILASSTSIKKIDVAIDKVFDEISLNNNLHFAN